MRVGVDAVDIWRVGKIAVTIWIDLRVEKIAVWIENGVTAVLIVAVTVQAGAIGIQQRRGVDALTFNFV